MSRIRVMLVDDHALVRAGLRSLLEHLGDMEVVCEASNGQEALELVQPMRPDVVLMDIMMPQLNGLETTAQLVKAHPDIRVLMLSVNSTQDFVLQALNAGARGYLVKSDSPEVFADAIRAVFRGDVYVTPALRTAQPGMSYRDPLTPRQKQILQLVAEGNTTKEIARKLDISVNTVETHRRQLMDALNIHDIAGLVRYALRIGLITVDR